MYFTPVDAKYTISTYNVVSEDARIIDANRPEKEAGPEFFKMSAKSPIDPPPDTGLKKAKVMLSADKSNGKIGFMNPETYPIIPDALNIYAADITATIGGSIFIKVFIPPSTPEIKLKYTSSRFLRHIKTDTAIIIGSSALIIFSKKCHHQKKRC